MLVRAKLARFDRLVLCWYELYWIGLDGWAVLDSGYARSGCVGLDCVGSGCAG